MKYLLIKYYTNNILLLFFIYAIANSKEKLSKRDLVAVKRDISQFYNCKFKINIYLKMMKIY